MTTQQSEIDEYDGENQQNLQKVQIDDIGEIVTGSTPSTKEEGNYGGDIPFVRVSDFGDNAYIKETEKKLTDKGLEEVKKRKIPKGTIMVSCIGNGLGKTAFATEICVTNQQINSVIPNDEFDNWYIYYKLTSNRERFQQYSGGSAQPILSKTKFSNIEIEVHDLEEQKKIGTILSSFDKKIRENRRICNYLSEISRILFESRLVKFDGYDGEVEYDDDFERKIPKKWEKRSLDQVADFLNGKAWQEFEGSDGDNDLPVIKIKELREGVTEDTDRVDESQCPNEYVIEDGDVIFSWSASLVLDLWTEGKAFLNQHLFKVTSNEFPRWFFYEWINYHIHRFRNIAEAKKTTMGHIKRSDLKEAKVLVPPQNELEDLSERIEPIFSTIVERRIENRNLEKLRDTLLPKLMSGEVRVNDINLDELEVDSEV